MATFNVHEAKSQLSKLLDQAQAGEEVIIAKAGVPVAKLVSIRPRPDRAVLFGMFKGKLVLDPGWDSDEVNKQIAQDFADSEVFPDDRQGPTARRPQPRGPK